MSELRDPHESRAVLVGGGRFVELASLPAVDANITVLAEVLADPVLWGLPLEHCTVLLDPSGPAVVDRALRAAAAEATDLLLIYYAGHGLLDPAGALHLATHATESDAVHSTAVPYEWIRHAVRRSRARDCLVILDCCYSARAASPLSPSADGPAPPALISGACVLASSSVNRHAFAPRDEPHTAFTGSLLRVMRDGIENGPAVLTVRDLWQETMRELRSRSRPVPALLSKNSADTIPVVRNGAHRVTDAVDREQSVEILTTATSDDVDRVLDGAVPALTGRAGRSTRPQRPVRRPPGRLISSLARAWLFLGVLGLFAIPLGVALESVRLMATFYMAATLIVALAVIFGWPQHHRLTVTAGDQPVIERGQVVWQLDRSARLMTELRPVRMVGRRGARVGGELRVSGRGDVEWVLSAGSNVIAVGRLGGHGRGLYCAPGQGARYGNEDGACARLADIRVPPEVTPLEVYLRRVDAGREPVHLAWIAPSIVARW